MAVVEIQGLTKRYGPVEALRGIDLSVEEGEIFGLLGPNGAGKTTTVEIISGLIPRDGGTVKVLGRDPERERHRLTRFIALQPQHMDFLDNATVGEIVALFRSLYAGVDRQRVRRILERLGLHDRQRTRFQHLSGGQRQRLNLALALIGNPRLVILDEPTAGLDPQARVQIHDFIREIRAEGRTVILTTHYLEEAEALCDRVAIIDHGKIIACDAPPPADHVLWRTNPHRVDRLEWGHHAGRSARRDPSGPGRRPMGVLDGRPGHDPGGLVRPQPCAKYPGS